MSHLDLPFSLELSWWLSSHRPAALSFGEPGRTALRTGSVSSGND